MGVRSRLLGVEMSGHGTAYGGGLLPWKYLLGRSTPRDPVPGR